MDMEASRISQTDNWQDLVRFMRTKKKRIQKVESGSFKRKKGLGVR